MEYCVTTDQDGIVPVRNIYCIGRNYKKHAVELKNEIPRQPFFFQKSTPALNTSNEIILPENREIHYELEIVVLIGKAGESISISNAPKYIQGYALGLDLTDRNFQSELKQKKLPWLLSKSFRGSAVVSSFQTKEILSDFWLKINGDIRQKGKASQMIFSISKQIKYLSGMIPLTEGDLIFTGTPSGVGPLCKGDKLVLGIGSKTIHSLSIS